MQCGLSLVAWPTHEAHTTTQMAGTAGRARRLQFWSPRQPLLVCHPAVL